MKIVVDGCDYEVEHTEAFLGNPERIVVWTMDEKFVGDVVLNHTLEFAAAYDQDHIDYFRFNEKTPKEIGEWIASTAEPQDDDEHQPTMYEEMQDFHGGDDWDHGQFDG